MRLFRVFVGGMLISAGLVMLAQGASGAVPAVSKACKSLTSLDKQLNKVVNSATYDSGTISNLAKSFKSGAKSAPKSIKSAMNTIASVASDAAGAGSTAAAAAALKKDGQKLTTAVLTWAAYISKNCGGLTTSTT